MEKKYINIKEASEILRVSKLTLRNWDKAGKLTAYRHPINNYRVFLVEDLEKLMSKITSGEKTILPQKKIKNIEPQKPEFYKLKVIHIQD